jgi:hypothetical protein
MGAEALRSRTGAVREKAAGAMTAQQRKAAEQLRSVADGLQERAATGGAPGQAADLARQAAGRLSATASWLDERSPADLVTEMRARARLRPGLVVAGAAFAGLVAGWMIRRPPVVPGRGRGRERGQS